MRTALPRCANRDRQHFHSAPGFASVHPTACVRRSDPDGRRPSMAADLAPRSLQATTFALIAAAIMVIEVGADPGHRFSWAAIPATAVPVALAILLTRILPD